jgi:hypothetical protein
MKKLFLLILLPIITFGEPEAHGELRITLINYGSTWDFEFSLNAVGAIWDENYELVEDYETVSVNITEYDIYADFEHILHPGVYPEFAVGLYKISVTEGIQNGPAPYFYMDWRSSDWSALWT